MENTLEQLSASALRRLLITEVQKFIAALDTGSTRELDEMKARLKRIYDLIAEKERAENLPLNWGKNPIRKISQPREDSADDSIPDAQSA